jgi:hypothetical protein
VKQENAQPDTFLESIAVEPIKQVPIHLPLTHIESKSRLLRLPLELIEYILLKLTEDAQDFPQAQQILSRICSVHSTFFILARPRMLLFPNILTPNGVKSLLDTINLYPEYMIQALSLNVPRLDTDSLSILRLSTNLSKVNLIVGDPFPHLPEALLILSVHSKLISLQLYCVISIPSSMPISLNPNLKALSVTLKGINASIPSQRTFINFIPLFFMSLDPPVFPLIRFSAKSPLENLEILFLSGMALAEDNIFANFIPRDDRPSKLTCLKIDHVVRSSEVLTRFVQKVGSGLERFYFRVPLFDFETASNVFETVLPGLKKVRSVGIGLCERWSTQPSGEYLPIASWPRSAQESIEEIFVYNEVNLSDLEECLQQKGTFPKLKRFRFKRDADSTLDVKIRGVDIIGSRSQEDYIPKWIDCINKNDHTEFDIPRPNGMKATRYSVSPPDRTLNYLEGWDRGVHKSANGSEYVDVDYSSKAKVTKMGF